VQEGFDFEHEEGPHGVSLEEALQWGRSRAHQVVLRIGNQKWSAGIVRKQRLPQWDDTSRVPVRRPI
jgi:hypothetical protein